MRLTEAGCSAARQARSSPSAMTQQPAPAAAASSSQQRQHLDDNHGGQGRLRGVAAHKVHPVLRRTFHACGCSTVAGGCVDGGREAAPRPPSALAWQPPCREPQQCSMLAGPHPAPALTWRHVEVECLLGDPYVVELVVKLGVVAVAVAYLFTAGCAVFFVGAGGVA